ncbi:hypothetical protein SAMN04487965_3282 [Microbulbifer donghaiensis]|uniref:Uncharacterized protein n=1 Tax=Microbulbifer donghaiensis TaxID=494016 RepID=A0A1M5GX09_9GAMM|nr:hypothetical protein [Microbulbifer donghaiensis]SHG08207.1 hypothetical protein SAMN04487965_3282 [Microbulbifer donghaiensis]
MAPARPSFQPAAGWTAFLAHFLFILAAWTVFIKYLLPVGFALAYGEPWSRHIYWDAWPIIHVWVGWALLARPWYTYRLAIAVSLLEIVIICSLFARFLADPDWSTWRTNWFVNKVFVLSCFILVLVTALARPGSLKADTNAK